MEAGVGAEGTREQAPLLLPKGTNKQNRKAPGTDRDNDHDVSNQAVADQDLGGGEAGLQTPASAREERKDAVRTELFPGGSPPMQPSKTREDAVHGHATGE